MSEQVDLFKNDPRIELMPGERIEDGFLVATSPRGEAVFSLDRRFRYTLTRWITPRGAIEVRGDVAVCRTVCFVMVNPSTADAFDDDPTVGECIKRARALGGDILEVRNLFALRATYPRELRRAGSALKAGHDDVNDVAIRDAARRAGIVIAAWGANGLVYDRHAGVRDVGGALEGIELHHLGLTKDGTPKHPLARGKHRIPANFAPVRWG